VPELPIVTKLSQALTAITSNGVFSAVDMTGEEEVVEFVDEIKHIENAGHRRRNEFITGRRCARLALNALGTPQIAMPADANGLPRWPEGTLGSISHTRGLCCAVAGFNHQLRGLGLDVEKTTRLSPAAIRHIVHPSELDYTKSEQVRSSLLFSAKEAFYKMQFPHWRAQPNFKDIALSVDVEKEELSVMEIAKTLPESLRAVAPQIQFRYCYFDDYVVTLCWLNR
jgi:4'-phosphopantetheinyl transferase EntD